MGAFKKYFQDLSEGVSSSLLGLKLTFRHMIAARKKVQPKSLESDNYFAQDTGIVTLEYPYEAIPVPDNGRYRLHNEIDDCIVCDKCAKICPVSCIDIVAIKSTEEIGLTSDGSSKRLYAATFDIDMAKCCYCGLCTTVCPTECLTMTSTFDYSEFDVRNMNYHFTDLSPEQALEKQQLYDQKQAEKAAAKLVHSQQSIVNSEPTINSEQPKPAFKPKFPVSKPASVTSEQSAVISDQSVVSDAESVVPQAKPVFKPKMPTPKIPTSENVEKTEPIEEKIENSAHKESEAPKPKPVFKPKMPAPKIPPIENVEKTEPLVKVENLESIVEPIIEKPKVVFKPKMMVPKIPPKKTDSKN